MPAKIPVCDLHAQYVSIKDEIDEAIARVLSKGRFILGEEVRSFELELAQYLGVQHVVGVGNATDALFLALKGAGEEAKRVLTTPLTFAATLESIVRSGGVPYMNDVDKGLNLQSADAYLDIVDAVVPVHLYGLPSRIDALLKPNRKYRIIQDCAQSFGAKIPMKDICCYSFYPSKILGCYGDGGAVVTDDNDIAEKVRMIRDHGRKSKYRHEVVGCNSRLDELQAAVLRVKLRHVDRWIRERRKIAVIYDIQMADLDGISLPFGGEIPYISVYNYYTIRVKNGKRSALMAFLESKGIETIICYPTPLHLEPAYEWLGYRKGDFPIAEQAANEVLSLPMYPELRGSQVDYICSAIREFYRK